MDAIAIVLGTRPEVTKIQPLLGHLHDLGIQTTVVSTGQQPDLLRQTCFTPDIDLQMPADCDPLEYAGKVAIRLNEALPRVPVLVQGDTASAYAGALAAKGLDVDLLHLEAGVRTGNPNNPWPEESFRVWIDEMSQFRFCPTYGNLLNLVKELGHRVRYHPMVKMDLCATDMPPNTWVTGNTGIDGLYEAVRPISDPYTPQHRVLVTLHRRESIGGPLRDIVEGIVRGALGYPGFEFVWPMHPNPALKAALPSTLPHNLRITGALEPQAFRELLAHSRAVVTDSGGVQEEAAALGVPCVVAREVTDRPESIESGHAVLAGRTSDGVLVGIRTALGYGLKSTPSQVFGDGRSAPRIAAIIRSL